MIARCKSGSLASAVLEFEVAGGARVRIATECAHSFAARLRGLVALPTPPGGAGLWIEPCRAVHTFGVRGALDLVFVSPCMVVQRIDRSVPPRRLRIGPRCRAVLELSAGEAARLGLREGTRLVWGCASEAARPAFLRGAFR